MWVSSRVLKKLPQSMQMMQEFEHFQHFVFLGEQHRKMQKGMRDEIERTHMAMKMPASQRMRSESQPPRQKYSLQGWMNRLGRSRMTVRSQSQRRMESSPCTKLRNLNMEQRFCGKSTLISGMKNTSWMQLTRPHSEEHPNFLVVLEGGLREDLRYCENKHQTHHCALDSIARRGNQRLLR